MTWTWGWGKGEVAEEHDLSKVTSQGHTLEQVSFPLCTSASSALKPWPMIPNATWMARGIITGKEGKSTSFGPR